MSSKWKISPVPPVKSTKKTVQEKKPSLTESNEKKNEKKQLQSFAEIDELFESSKKKRKINERQPTTGSEADGTTRTKHCADDNKKKRFVPQDHDEDNDSEDSEDHDDDGGFEYIDEEQDVLPYGIIKSQYRKVNIINPEAPVHRVDKESGLPVYKAHLLKVGEGGGTALCPFDCNCCF